MQKKIKIGVIGAGHLGKYHINHLSKHANVDFVGFFDVNKDSAEKVVAEFSVKSFENIDELTKAIDKLCSLELATKLGLKARQRVEEMFTDEIILKKLNQILTLN